MTAQQRALRGELAFNRHLYLRRYLVNLAAPAARRAAVQNLRQEAELVATFAPDNADALTDLALATQPYAVDRDLEREVRLALAEESAGFARRAILAAPSDYLPWLALARGHMTAGHWDRAEAALEQARALVPHSSQVRMFGVWASSAGDERQVP
jgi:hypothetical protein